jgi:DNA-binding HxlR family transcriptional regulator
MSPRNTEVTDEECVAVREVLARVGDKWSVQTIALLGKEPHRFMELQRAIEGISQRMLTLTLRGLQRDGLVARTVWATVPPSTQYALTPLGRTLLEPVLALSDWARRHRQNIQAARERFDATSALPRNGSRMSSSAHR